MAFAASLPDPLRALLAFVAILMLIVPLCMAFGALLGALFARQRRAERAVAFGGTLAATSVAPFILLAASESASAFAVLLAAGLALPGAAWYGLDRWARRQ